MILRRVNCRYVCFNPHARKAQETDFFNSKRTKGRRAMKRFICNAVTRVIRCQEQAMMSRTERLIFLKYIQTISAENYEI